MNRIKELRKKRGMTVKDLADLLGISQSMLTNYENGSSTPRDNSVWENLSNFFNVSVSYLMGLTDTLERVREGMYLPFIVIDEDRVQKEYIEQETPVEFVITSVTEYALLANISQLDEDDMKDYLDSVQKLIREKYVGRCPEIRLQNHDETE